MLMYAVLFEEDDYVYLKIMDGDNETNVKMTNSEYEEWSKDKFEV